MKKQIIKFIFQLLLFGIAFWIVGWKIWLAIILMLWANNGDFVSKNIFLNNKGR